MSALLVRIDSQTLQDESTSIEIKRKIREYIILYTKDCTLYLNFQGYQDEIESFVEDFGILTAGDRENNDLNQIYSTINDYCSNGNFVIIFGTKEEFDMLNYERQRKQQGYHFIYLTPINNQYVIEEVEVFKPMFNRNIDIDSNLKNIARSYLTSETMSLISKASYFQGLLEKQTKEIIDSSRLCTKILELSQEASNNIGTGLSETILKLEKNMNDLIQTSHEEVQRSYKIIEEFRKEDQFQMNNLIDRTIIKYPTEFNENQMNLSHTPSNDWANHVFTITNQTTYVWKNLSIIFVQNNMQQTDFNDKYYGKRLTEIQQILPNETITVEVDYSDELIEKLGFYQVQLFYHSQPISNRISLSFISVVGCTVRERMVVIEIRNNIRSIPSSHIEYKNNQNNNIKASTLKLPKGKIERLTIQALKGESYLINFYKSKDVRLMLCEPYNLTVG